MDSTVLVVDDHAGFRSVARAVLESEGFRVVGEAADGAEALARAEQLRPGVVLLDVQLPDIDGFAVATLLAGGAGAPDVVLVSTRPAGAYRRRLATTSARGFLSKADLSGPALRRILGRG